MFVNAVYYPNWRIYRDQPPSRINLKVVSHVFYAFAWVKSDGTVHLSDEWADSQIDVDGQKGCLHALANLKQKYTHLKLILSIGGGGAASKPFPDISSSRSGRETFAKSAKKLIESFSFDGVDVDWEHPGNERQGKDFILLLKAIRQELPSPRFIVTSALPAGQWALKNIDLEKAQKYLDFINLMTYDFAGPWEPLSGHHAQLFAPRHPHNEAARTSCEAVVKYVLSEGVPSKKLLMGIPTYGRSFLGTNGIGSRFNGNGGEEETFEYKDLPQAGTTEQVDRAVGAAFCIGGGGGFVSYDNPETVGMKASFVVEKRLGGIFYWTATADSTGPRSLIETGFRALHT